MSKQRASHPALLLTTREAAAELGVHERTLRRYMSSGLLVYRRLPGGHYRIPEESIRNLWGGEDSSNLDGGRRPQGTDRPSAGVSGTGSAMSEIGADRRAIDGYLGRLEGGADPVAALNHQDIPDFVRDFVASTLGVALHGKPHEVAASFCHGRENLLPDVLTGIQRGLGPNIDQAPIFRHYLQRHITLDHDEHGPLALRLLSELCGDDAEKLAEANRAGVESITARSRLWDGILAILDDGETG